MKIFQVSLFRELVPAFRKPPVTLKVVPPAACNPEIVPKVGPGMYTGAKESWNRNLMRFSKHLDLVSVFKVVIRNFIFFFT